jgi:hypothetical protein
LTVEVLAEIEPTVGGYEVRFVLPYRRDERIQRPLYVAYISIVCIYEVGTSIVR